MRRADIYATSANELWKAVSGFGSGQGADTAVTGATEPVGAGPFVSDGSVTWKKLTAPGFTGNIATFTQLGTVDRKSGSDVLATGLGTSAIDFDARSYDNRAVIVTGHYSPSWTPARGLGTSAIDFDSGSYDNKTVIVTGHYSPSWTPTRVGIYTLTLTMDGVGGWTVTLPTMVGTKPTIDTTPNESTEVVFFWNGAESVVISAGV